MAYEFRNPNDFLYGTLSTAAAVSDTTLASADFATLSSGYSTGNYLPLVLLNASTKVHEKVWVTAHAASSTSVTVVRGRESTSAQAWPAGTQWIVAPTIRDALLPSSSSAPPADPHVGRRDVMLDKSDVRQYTRYGGWQADVGVAVAAQVGKNRSAVAVPDGHVIIMRTGFATGVTDAAGQFTVTFPTAFPNAALAVVTQVTTAFVNPVSVVSESAASFVCKAWRYSALNVAGAEPAGTTVTIGYLAIGY